MYKHNVYWELPVDDDVIDYIIDAHLRAIAMLSPRFQS